MPNDRPIRSIRSSDSRHPAKDIREKYQQKKAQSAAKQSTGTVRSRNATATHCQWHALPNTVQARFGVRQHSSLQRRRQSTDHATRRAHRKRRNRRLRAGIVSTVFYRLPTVAEGLIVLPLPPHSAPRLPQTRRY